MAIDESDCWARELSDMDDIERQCPGTLAGLRSFFIKGDGNDTVLFGDPLNAQYAMAVVRVHFQCYKKLLQLNWDEAAKEAEEVSAFLHRLYIPLVTSLYSSCTVNL